ncbi:MAG TPA: Hpt domain-containing protein [Bacteroidia bacterium]|nr:Hpt domain-containing protein [Bacteroidia bacterium]
MRRSTRPYFMDTKHINLAELRTLGHNDETFIRRMLQTCAEQSPGLLDGLKKATEENDTGAAAACAHRLRPTFHYLGRSDLSELLRAIEDGTFRDIDEMKTISQRFLDGAGRALGEVSEVLRMMNASS